MKYVVMVLLACLLITNQTLWAFTYEPYKKYHIDGPANIRDNPKGKVIDSLNDNTEIMFIRIFDKDWALIDYYPTSGDDKDFSRLGWTHIGNLKPKNKTIGQLIKEEKVQFVMKYVLQDVNEEKYPSYIGQQMSFDPRQYQYMDEIDLGQADPLNKFDVNIYCLDGTVQKNEIISIEYEWGVESYRVATIKTEKPIPNGICIYVNGVISPETQNQLNHKPQYEELCPPSNDPRVSCEYSVGDFNNDGVTEGVLVSGYIGAPTNLKWELFQVDAEGKINIQGTIGYDFGP